MITAGNDTTVSMLAGGLWALHDHPDQLLTLRNDPALIPGAVEEILRWFNPLHYFRRTATDDVELGGKQIANGDKVAMYYTSANRDETVSQMLSVSTSRDRRTLSLWDRRALLPWRVHLARLEGRAFLSNWLRDSRR